LEDNASTTSSSSESDAGEEKFYLMADHDLFDDLYDVKVGSTCNKNDYDYDDLYDAFQQLLVKSSKSDTANKKLKFNFKELQSKFEKSLEEE